MLSRNTSKYPLFLLLSSLALTVSAAAQTKNTEHTLILAEGARPTAKIQDVAWIAGHWRGEALGGITEEIWAPPIGNSMAGMFRLVKDGELGFLEILTLVEEEGSLVLRLKHFSGDLVGWEEKDESVEFRFVQASDGRAHFEGMTFERDGEDGLKIYVANRLKDGTLGELAFVFRKEP